MAFADQLENNRRSVFAACCRMSLVFAIVYLNIFNLLLWLSVPFFLNLALIIQREESTMPSWPYMLLLFFVFSPFFFFFFFFYFFFFFLFSFNKGNMKETKSSTTCVWYLCLDGFVAWTCLWFYI